MPQAESPNQCAERLSGLPVKDRLAAFRAIQDPAFRKQVVRELPSQIHADIVAESMIDNLNRNIQLRHGKKNPNDRAA